MSLLSLDDLVCGLELFGGDRYHSLNVFLGDVKDKEWQLFEQNGKSYELQVFPAYGVARLTRNIQDCHAKWFVDEVGGSSAVGLGLGLLVGSEIGAGENRPQRVFPLYFDRCTNKWSAYSGGLLRWMKKALFLKRNDDL